MQLHYALHVIIGKMQDKSEIQEKQQYLIIKIFQRYSITLYVLDNVYQCGLHTLEMNLHLVNDVMVIQAKL